MLRRAEPSVFDSVFEFAHLVFSRLLIERGVIVYSLFIQNARMALKSVMVESCATIVSAF